MNAHAEQFNRTVQEQFVDYHEDLLFDDLTALNRNLADWLRADHTVLPHQSLGRQSPVQLLLQHQPECHRWWTHILAGLCRGDLPYIMTASNSTGCTMSGRLCNTRTGPYLNEDDEENKVKSVKIADHNLAF